MQIKRRTKVENSELNSLYFLEDLQDSLRKYSIENDLESSPLLIQTNYKYHSELHDIVYFENEQQKSLLKLFEKFSLIITSENKQIKIFLTAKEKREGLYQITDYLKEFKKLLNEKMPFSKRHYNEITLFD